MKKRKSTIILLSVLIVSLLFSAGCTGKEPMSSVDDTQPVIIEQPSEVVSEVVSEVLSEPVSEEPSEPEVDPNEELTWQFLEVDEEWYKSYEGMGLKRDGKLYSLSDGVPVENWEKTGLCLRHGKGGTPSAVGDTEGERIVPDNSFVIPCVSGEDDLAWYGKPVKSLTLVPMSFYGYTVPIMMGKISTGFAVFENGKKEYDTNDDLLTIEDYQKKSVQLISSDGSDKFSDFRNLTKDDEYTLKWNDGMDHETKLTAYWCYYKPTSEDPVVLVGSATDDSQITKYDFSSVPSGLYYMVESYAMVEVRND